MNKILEDSKLLTINMFWDAFCFLSVVGIWPRFIEPKLIFVNRLHVKLLNLPRKLEGFKIVQLSDLHFNNYLSESYLEKLIAKVNGENPHLIVFTGDFICCGKLGDRERLKKFLSSLKAPCGTYAVLGNHDYNGYVSINKDGDYDVSENTPSQVFKGFERLFTTIKLTKKVTAKAQNLHWNEELISLIHESGIVLLHNETKQIQVEDTYLNICGLGEYMLDRVKPGEAYSKWDKRYPSIVLIHNPDAITKIAAFPGDLILSGHTHGGQINLPYLWKKFSLMENQRYKSGLFRENGRWIYVNRGIGSVMPFRFFAPPEIASFTLGGTR